MTDRTFILAIDDRDPQEPRLVITEPTPFLEPTELARVQAKDWISAKVALGFPLTLQDERRLRGELDDWMPQVLW